MIKGFFDEGEESHSPKAPGGGVLLYPTYINLKKIQKKKIKKKIKKFKKLKKNKY